jgi:hypothetical protein
MKLFYAIMLSLFCLCVLCCWAVGNGAYAVGQFIGSLLIVGICYEGLRFSYKLDSNQPFRPFWKKQTADKATQSLEVQQ